jgi:glycosyltransferase involved in cell wall biosynthesis
MPSQDSKDRCRHAVFAAGYLGFPHGMATAKRIAAQAKGLAAAGTAVRLLITYPADRPYQAVNVEPSGVYDGLPFDYASGVSIRSASWVGRRLHDMRGLLGTAHRLWRLKRRGELDVVFLHTLNTHLLFWFAAWCRCLRVPLVLELSEWPLDQAAAHGHRAASARLYCRYVFRLVDAVIPISRRIESRVVGHRETSGSPLPSFLLPMLVDEESFTPAPDPPGGRELVCSGSLAYHKIVDVLLDTAAELLRRRCACTLSLMGQASREDIRGLREGIASRGIGKSVQYLGYLDGGELVKRYQQAAMLLAPMPDDAQSTSRFPTKIGEYLACGRPVVTNPVGEIACFLADGRDAFFAPRCTPHDLADTIETVFRDPIRAEAVARVGRETAVAAFGYRRHGVRLKAFLDTLIASA